MTADIGRAGGVNAADQARLREACFRKRPLGAVKE
jgi:hypothetical protein